MQAFTWLIYAAAACDSETAGLSAVSVLSLLLKGISARKTPGTCDLTNIGYM